MFTGKVCFEDGYHALGLDDIMTLMHNLKYIYSYEITDIKGSTNEKVYFIKMGDIEFTIDNDSILITYYKDDIEFFNEIYRYLKNKVTGFEDFKVGDIVYSNRKQGVIKSIKDDRFVNVLFDGEDEIKEEYKCWLLKFN